MFSDHILKPSLSHNTQSPIKLCSPMGKRKRDFKTSLPRTKRIRFDENTKINEIKIISLNTILTISTKESINSLKFNISSSLENSNQLLITQCNLILNNQFFSKYSDDDQIFILKSIHRICNSVELTIDNQLSELGIIYYLITQSMTFSGTTNFVQSRIQEIELEAKILKTDYEQLCPPALKKLHPSCSQAYLLRTFAFMIFPPNGEFNPGCCYVLKTMMESRLSIYIAPQIRVQVLNIVDKLIKDESFLQLFLQPFDVAKEMEDLIRIDLKLKQHEKLKFNHTRIDLLLALLTPIGQVNEEGNCFAIGPTINFISMHPEVYIKILRQALATGFLEFDESKIPLNTIFESSKYYNDDFQDLISYNQLSQLNSFNVVLDCIETPKITHKSPQHLQSVNKIVKTQFGDNTDYAKQLYTSLKQNLLQRLMASIFQFASLNVSTNFDFKDFKDSDYSTKEVVIYEIKSSIFDSRKNRTMRRQILTHSKGYINKFIKKLMTDLFFVDYNNSKIKLVDNTINMKYHEKGLPLDDQNLEDFEPCKELRRLCKFEKNQLIPIDSLSLLVNYLKTVVKDLEINESADFQPISLSIIKFLKSNNFIKKLAKILVEYNEDLSIPEESYIKADSLFFTQTGSYSHYLKFWKEFPISFKKTIIKQDSVSQIFEQICKKIFTYSKSNPKAFQNIEPIIITESDAHVFNLSPFNFKNFWSKNFSDEMQSKILGRAKKASAFTADKRLRILRELFDEVKVNKINAKIPKKYDLKQFYDRAIKLIDTDFHKKLIETIENVMTEVLTQQLKNHLPVILKNIVKENATIDYNILNHDLSFNTKEYIGPYRAARIIQKSLLVMQHPIYLNMNKIERQINKFFNLPNSYEIGNYNWIGSYNENPYHEYICVKYNFIKQKLDFYMKNQFDYVVFTKKHSEELLKETSLFFPK